MRPIRLYLRTRLEVLHILVTAAFHADAPATLGSLGLDVLRAVTAPLSALWLKFLVDGATAQDGGRIALAVVGLGLTAGIPWLAGGMSTQLRLRLQERVGFELERQLASTVSRTPRLTQFEQPRFLDLLQLIRSEQGVLGQAIGSLVVVAGALVQTITVLVLLSTVHPLLMLLPLAGVPVYVAERAWQRRLGRSEEDVASLDRLARHLEDLVSVPSTAKEVRTARLGGILTERHATALDVARQERARAQARGAALTSVSWAGFALVFAGAVSFVIWRASQGLATAGDVVLAISLAGLARISIANVIRTTSRMARQVRIADRFLELQSLATAEDDGRGVSGAVPATIEQGIEVDGLRFTYPDTDTPVLQDITLSLPAGSIVALVGENGAGKSSLVKVLCGFYAPTGGDIRFDGLSMREMDPTEWRSRVAGTFQDYARFELTVGDAIGIGDLPHRTDRSAVGKAVDDAGAESTIRTLPRGLDTQLGRAWPDGHDLSGGQWQRVALARGLMRAEPLLLVLDEPASSLDAETEHALFERMATIARDRSRRGLVTVLVSQRFSTVRLADVIVVLDQGRIIEQGSHDELMRQEGTYAELYGIQASSFS